METIVLTAIAVLAIYTMLALNSRKEMRRSHADFREDTFDLIALDKRFDLSKPLLEKLDHSIIAEDREHDLSRSFDYEEEVRPLDLFELDKEDDVSQPFA